MKRSKKRKASWLEIVANCILPVVFVIAALLAIGNGLFELGKFRAEDVALEAQWKQTWADELRNNCADIGEALHVKTVYFKSESDDIKDDKYYGYCELRFPNPDPDASSIEVDKNWKVYGDDKVDVAIFIINKLKKLNDINN
jgi:hypothetical protein